MSRYAKHFNTKVTPQSEPIPGTAQVQNSAGGYSFEVTPWVKLDRFLVLGTEGGSYYASEQKMTKDSGKAVLECLKLDGTRTVLQIVAISEAGRAPKNDAAIFALAMAAKMGDDATRKLALMVVPLVCRIGTHLFQFAEAIQAFGGWGRGTRRAVANWYSDKTVDQLAYQLVKYRQRNGWEHRDLMRLSHVRVGDKDKAQLVKFAVRKPYDHERIPAMLAGFLKAETATDAKQIVQIIADHPKLPWEAIPSEHLKSPDVWAALLPEMPLTAMVRNLARMTANGLIAPMSEAVRTIENKLADQAAIQKSKMHPIAVLAALLTYKQGHGQKGNLTWTPEARVLDALDNAFYLAFGNVEAANKRTMLALDISGSMGGGEIAGIPGLTPRMGSVAMAMVTARSERDYHFTGFGSTFHTLNITAKQTLDQAIEAVSGLHFEGTDCALPMLYAMKSKIPVDTFVTLTDNETWQGSIHASQALKQYRERMGIPAKLVVVGMVANDFTIADKADRGMLDVVGFDTATPNIIRDFAVE